jgi:hypothetical protein
MRHAVFGRACFAIVLGAGVFAVTPALAMDPVCQSLLTWQGGLKNKPFHMYMTSEDRFDPKLAKAAASIGMAGVKKSEEIWTGKDIYVLNEGTWIDMRTSFADMMNDAEKNDPDIRKVREAERCQALPDEVAFGQPATVYQTHNPQTGVSTKIWLSKATHLPLKSEITTDAGPMKSLTSSRYEYGSVQAPANAVSMADMMKMRMKKK